MMMPQLAINNVLAFYRRLDKFIIAMVFLLPCLITIIHVDYTLHTLAGKYQNLTGGGLNHMLMDIGWSLLFPDAKQRCPPAVFNNDSISPPLKVAVVQNGDNKWLVNKTIEPNDSIVIFSTHPLAVR